MEYYKTIESMGYHERILYKAFPGLSDKEMGELLNIVYGSASPTETTYALIKAYNFYKKIGDKGLFEMMEQRQKDAQMEPTIGENNG